MPKSKAVDNPLCTEIRDVCLSQHLGVEFETNKHYPREIVKDQIHSGRVRVQIKNDDGSPLNESITSREFDAVQLLGHGKEYSLPGPRKGAPSLYQGQTNHVTSPALEAQALMAEVPGAICCGT